VVGMERDAEEVAVRADRLPGKVVGRAAVARHLTVCQLHVEVGKLDVVALRGFVAAARHIAANDRLSSHNTLCVCVVRKCSCIKIPS